MGWLIKLSDNMAIDGFWWSFLIPSGYFVYKLYIMMVILNWWFGKEDTVEVL